MSRPAPALAPAPGSRAFVVAIVTAQVLTQIGAFTLPALLPDYIALWSLSKTEAGWLAGVFFLGYCVAVPILVSATDLMPGRSIYLIGSGMTALAHGAFAFADGFWLGLLCRIAAGIGWAGCYMPGLKVLTDTLEGRAQSRAVSWHAAGVGFAGAASFGVAGTLAAVGGPRAAFLFGAASAATSFVIAFVTMPRTAPVHAAGAAGRRLLDVRPVFRNRTALAYILGYAVHTGELAALRSWSVTFLTLTAARTGGAPDWLPGPTAIATLMGMLGVWASVSGNELSVRLGRKRMIFLAMFAAAAMAALAGWTTGHSYALACLFCMLWNAAIYLDSSALTAGTVGAADKAVKGATMAVHSTAGYAGGFLAPLVVGAMLDGFGGDSVAGWGLAFASMALFTAPGPLGLWLLRPRPLPGDKA